MLIQLSPELAMENTQELNQIEPDADSTEHSASPSLTGGLLTGIAASVCCVGPFLLLTLGVSGAWIGNLSAMTSFRPYLIGITLVLLGFAFRKLYLLPRRCAPAAQCATPQGLKTQRRYFWLVSLFVLVMIGFPYYGPYLFA